MEKDFTVAVLISGRGSNFRCLLEKAENYRIIGVLADNHEATGLEYGRQAGIACHSFARSDYASRRELKQAVFNQCRELRPDLIAMAGYMQIVQSKFVEAFYGRILNIHPSLLPQYAGLDVHQRVLAAQEQETGCTVHFIDRGVDTGPIIARAKCECRPDDDEDTLAARVLTYEHELYPWVVSSIARGYINLTERAVHFHENAKAEAASNGFILGGGE